MDKIYNCHLIKSYGDSLKNGIYKIHSRFNKAINFISNDSLVSTVKQEIGAVPLNIVVNGVDLDQIRTLEIEDNYVFINDFKYDCELSKQFNSTIKYENIVIEKLKFNLNVFEKCLLEKSPTMSLIFLLDATRKKYFRSTFEKEFIKRFESGVEMIFSSKYIEGIKKIKGTGFGFTPSGDDFICGLLMGLNITQNFFQTNLTNLLEEIYNSARGKNPISNAFLFCAKQGLMFEKFKKLVYSILYLDEKQVIENTRRLCSIGETSGSDMGIGLLMSIKGAGLTPLDNGKSITQKKFADSYLMVLRLEEKI